ncbi:MATE family efflux transporter (plasmid) [Paenibacillus rhizovicinus]|uniref:Probable multidrug resistance protein NorM n=1 Tax=Paenibacillus rhizovicinus TaxID=2704463 RepID=A0A6C0PAT6_9BACL|nr:MATE family efflux transporter [Paenibacillus rhizovicinus]QHW35485.1 MATE family efflux transporter [Paenibacillus rhizovicinus]
MLSIALPAIGEAYLQSLLGVIDAWFIARTGLVAVNAVGVTNIYSLTYIGVFTAVSTALSVFLSRAVGAKNVEQGRSVIWHGYIIALALGLIISAATVRFAVPLLHIMGANRELEASALPYFGVVLGISPLIALFTAQSAAFRATGHTKTPLKVAVEMNAVHVVLDYVLIFGIGSIPGFGLAGAAWAMVLARLYALLRLYWKSRSVEAIRLRKEDCTWRPSVVVDMISFAVPAAAERLSMRLGQVIYFGLIVRMGINVYATHTIAGTLTVFASTVGAGFATAASVTIGQAIGSKDVAAVQSYRRWSYILSAISMTVITAAICIFSPWIGLLFTDNQQVIQLLLIVLAIDTISQPFLASTLVDTSAIQAGGNSKYPMIVTTIGIWGIRTLGVYLFAWNLGWGLPAVWASIAADNALRAVLFARYRGRGGVYHSA